MLKCYHRTTLPDGLILVEEISLVSLVTGSVSRLRGFCGRLANRFLGLIIKAGHF